MYLVNPEQCSMKLPKTIVTRMHSSRMHTVHSSGRILGGGLLLVGVCSWGVSALGGCLLLGDVCSWGVSALGGCLLLEGVCSWGVCSWGWCLLLAGVSAIGGCLLLGGVCSGGLGGCLLLRVCVVSQHALRQTPPPPCGQTDACKNITFTTSLWMVIIA